MWDIAANPSDSSSALQFRPFGSGTNASLLSTSGNWTINGTISSGSITAPKINATATGMSEFATNMSSQDDWINSPISIRERGLAGAGDGEDRDSPNLNFHWSARVANSLWMNASGYLSYGSYSSTGVPSANGIFRAGAYQVGNTTVIDTSRNLVNIGTVSSGTHTITANGNAILMQTASDPSNYYAYISANYNYGQVFSIKAKGAGSEYTLMDWGDAAGLEFHGGAAQSIKFSSHNLSSIGTLDTNAFWTTSSATSHWGAGGTVYGTLTWDAAYASIYGASGKELRLGSSGGQDKLTIKTDGNVTINGGGALQMSDTTVIDASRNITSSQLYMGSWTPSDATSVGRIGKVTDRAAGSITNQLGTNANSIWEIVDYDWTVVLAKVTDAGNFTASGNVTAYSDERLKTNIQTLDSKKALQMRGVSFIKDGVKGSGVIAQEIEEIAPELVLTADDEMGTKSVAYGNLVGYLIEAIKEQQKEIEYMKSEIKHLQENNNGD